ncbi:MAG TPA: hypothetical protein VGO86_03685 [Candidatus Dormibacteraeota bacterium]
MSEMLSVPPPVCVARTAKGMLPRPLNNGVVRDLRMALGFDSWRLTPAFFQEHLGGRA